MKILVSNDDGVYAPGLRTLVRYLKQIAEVVVVAPDRNHSGASHSLTLHSPLRLKVLEKDVMSVEGTPTDCVHLATTGILDDLPDMVVSGINEGANLGDDIMYSGTVAAAMEGRKLGYPAIAVSLVGEAKHFDTAAQITKNLVLLLQQDRLPKKTILNVNVPDLPIAAIQGFDVTRLGNRHIAEPVVKDADPRGRPIYWVGPAGEEEDAGPGTDFYAINHGRVSITPLHIDLTDYGVFDTISRWTQKCFR